ncbi:transcription elongation factor S-II [Xylaria palmicola]|nr:transcription elongation factor S-II [Xylaria palmicola]
MPPLARVELLAAARAFCDSFAQKKPPEEILSRLSADVRIREHGLAQLAPFLGREYRGIDGARAYFGAVGRLLSYEDMRFVEFIAGASSDEDEDGGGDGDGGKVVARGSARFTWTETGQSWDETFVYILGFDGRARLNRYEVWADSGAAYLASRGDLGEEEK